MEDYQAEIVRIRELLSTHPDGLSITEIAGLLKMNRNTVAKYMDILQIQGAVDGRRKGTSKVFFLSERLPVASLRKICTQPYYVLNADGMVADLNQEFCSLVGMTPDLILHHPGETLPVRFLDGSPSGQPARSALRGMEQRVRGQVVCGEKILPATLLLFPVVFETGKPGVAIIAETGTPAPAGRSEPAAADTLALLDNGTEYIVRRTAEGITRYVNEPYCRATGKTREELIGRPFKPLVTPEDAERIRLHIAGLSVQYPVGTIEYRVVMANGEQRHQRWVDRAVFNSRGELDTINSFGTDITDQVLAMQKLKKMQETLEESIVSRTEELRGVNRQLYTEIAQRERMEEQLLLAQFAMDRATDLVFWIDRSARIRYANDTASESLQYRKEELMACPFGRIVPAYTLTEWDTLWQDLKNRGTIFRETQIARRDGTQFPAEIRMTYLEYRGKQFVYTSSRDLSEQIRMDMALKEANKKLNIYTSIARHDIQNKITVLLAYLGRTKKAVTEPRILEYLNRQEQAAKAIGTEINLTREFKDMGMRPPEWQHVTAIVAAAAARHHNAPARIVTDLPDIEIYADSQIEHVFDRLFEKCLENGDGTREIRVMTRIRDGVFSITIEDNGPGIPPEEKDQIFELRADRIGNRGLFIAREILSLTAITLAENGEPGKGIRFEIGVPETYYRVPEKAP